MPRIYLSPPDVGPADLALLTTAFEEGWIAPVGPQLTAFETELCTVTHRKRAVAVSSGTAALHLALIIGGVSAGDQVLVSSLTFVATANAVRYVGATPVFIDSDRATWNMDPDLLATELEDAARANRRYAAVIAVDLYGQPAEYREIVRICSDNEVLLISDAAEALGAELAGSPAGSFGAMATLSFNGNKIVTTSGGGALVTDRNDWADDARFLATQARDPATHYQHSRLGYNYRMSNLLAALGRSQLADLARRVAIRRDHNQGYRAALAHLPGFGFMPEIEGGKSTFWLTALTIDPKVAGIDRSTLISHLESRDIEARPVWKPMHLQPLYAGCRAVGGSVAAELFEHGLCLPSGSTLTVEGRNSVIDRLHEVIPAR